MFEAQATTFPQLLGSVLRHHRKSKGVKQEYLAQALGVGPSAWSRIESGNSTINVVQLRQVARMLETSPSELLRQVESAERDLRARIPGFQVLDQNARKLDERTKKGLWILGGATLFTAIGTMIGAMSRADDDEDDWDD